MKAAIDIGTNTVLLLVAEIENGVLKPIHEEQRIPRLGKGVDADRVINEDATNRVTEALLEYQKILQQEFPEVGDVIVTATSAVRDATNRDEFIQKVKEKTGFGIRLLSGNEEAEWTAKGALSVLNISPKNETLILDIGGGSTEIAQLKFGVVTDAHSYDMGSVRFTERFLQGNPPSKKEIDDCRNEVRNMYHQRSFETGDSAIAVGVAGTLTTLAGIILNLDTYQPEKLAGYSLKSMEVERVIEQFSIQKAEDMLARHPVYLKGRADIFLAGMLILEGFMQQFGLENILVSTGGIRHGAIINGVNS
jgi:exopolyphosphatase/guanosine-5'-triphosphate,3'-diphosphate pyrophosphatase